MKSRVYFIRRALYNIDMLTMELRNVIDGFGPQAGARWDMELQDGRVQHLRPSEADPDVPSQLLLPPLCHPHIHLDKAYILTCHHSPCPPHPDYSDLGPVTGSFDEALANTSQAKARYTEEDLYLRGSQLLATSYNQGVTSMRGFVELDHVTGTLPLLVATRLKQDFAHLLELQICVFAQDPIFSTVHGEANRAIITAALTTHSAFIGALGTTPYVETSRVASLANIEWAITTASMHDIHLDFHLDYSLAIPSSCPVSRPLAFSVVDLLEKHNWRHSRTVALGHCTQLTVMPDAERQILADAVLSKRLPIHFVGLPTSDMYMMGRPGADSTKCHHRPRGTIHIPSMIRDHGLSACIGVNNVGNPFTPFGTGDPLQLASWAVGIYQYVVKISICFSKIKLRLLRYSTSQPPAPLVLL